jgi:hypothetical protein
LQRRARGKARAATEDPEHDAVASDQEEGEESGNEEQETVISRQVRCIVWSNYRSQSISQTRAKAKARAAADKAEHDAAASDEGEDEESENEKQSEVCARMYLALHVTYKLGQGDANYGSDVDRADTPTPPQNNSRLKVRVYHPSLSAISHVLLQSGHRVPILDLALLQSLKLVSKVPSPTETQPQPQPQPAESQVSPGTVKRQTVEGMVEAAKDGDKDKSGGKVRSSWPFLPNCYLTRLPATTRRRTVRR